MNPILRDYFYFTKSQRKALIFVSVLIGLLLLFNQYAHLIFHDEVDFDVVYIELKYQELLDKESEHSITVSDKGTKDYSPKKLFPFDPNQTTKDEWQALGLSEAQASSILKYRKKGGIFKKKTDLKRMYVVSEELYADWEHYIQLPDHLNEKHRSESKNLDLSRKSENTEVDINEADSAMLRKVRGIGPVYASRIIRFRNALGGFYSLDQLTEVWGINDSIMEKLRSQLILNEIRLKPLKINQLEASELKAHPYLNWQEANTIVNYRKQHGDFKQVSDLKKIYLLSDSLIEKLSPYLEFD